MYYFNKEQVIMKICTICGERNFRISKNKLQFMTTYIESLIVNEKVECFLLCYRGKFVDMCDDIITELADKYPYINKLSFSAFDGTLVFDGPEIDPGFTNSLTLNDPNCYFSPYNSSLQNKFFLLLETMMSIKKLISISDFVLFYFDFAKYKYDENKIIQPFSPATILQTTLSQKRPYINLFEALQKQ